MPQNNEARVVRLTNIFDFDYTHAYGGVPYQLRAGETLLFPFAIGDHLATHLARQAIIRKAPIRDDNADDGRGGESKRSDRPLWDETATEVLKARIIQDAYTEDRKPVMTEAERYKEKFEELNKQFPGLTSIPGAASDVVITTTSTTLGDQTGTGNQTPGSTTDGSPYKDKAEVIAALNAKEIKFDARKSKSDLEKLLA